ncbi:FACT complex subunit SPT16 [Striga hermonthica]|uniref:FACT complex subunit n=1 Tax=Striga hermonthica TaxID=68872 RepID=A0A9N7NYZ9_STRHE|nr:FACT complex subunit SPT16 [Striga hermonthica]
MAEKCKSNRSAYTIDLNTFTKRLQTLYANWRQHKNVLWGSSNYLVMATSPSSEDLRYLKSSSLNIWLLGYVFPETIMVFGDKQIHFLCSQKKASLLEAIKEPAKESLSLDVVMHKKVLLGRCRCWKASPKIMVKAGDANGVVGVVYQDKNEIAYIKKAAYIIACTVKNFVVPKVEKAIDEERKVTHASLTNDTEKALLDPAKIGLQLKAKNVDIYHPPIFQRSRYNSYCSNIARTYLIDSDAVQRNAYRVLLRAHEAAILAVRPRKKACVVYEAALSVVKIDAPDFLPNLTKSVRTGISLQFRESGLSLDVENEKVLKAGMALNVSIGFQNLQAKTKKGPKAQNFSTLLTDTVLVMDSRCDVATSASSKLFKDVAYSFNEEDDVDEPLRKKLKSDCNAEEKEFMSSKATLKSDNGEMSKEELQKQH